MQYSRYGRTNTLNSVTRLSSVQYLKVCFRSPKASSGETQAKKVPYLASGSEVLSSLCVRARMTLYDIRSQEHSSLLSFLRGEKEISSKGGFGEKIESGFFFSTNQRRAFPFFDQSEKSIVHLRPRSSVARWEIVLKLENTSKIPHRLYIFIGLYNLYISRIQGYLLVKMAH